MPSEAFGKLLSAYATPAPNSKATDFACRSGFFGSPFFVGCAFASTRAYEPSIQSWSLPS